MILIGLIGERQVGKSLLSDHLVAAHGFAKMHPFDGGKAASLALFEHYGASRAEAISMLTGPEKDRPCRFLPKDQFGEHYHPRFFIEKFGAFMGETLGPEWTIEKEISKLHERGARNIISESIVFEIDAFRDLGGIVVEVLNPVRQGKIKGIETDRVVSTIIPDHSFLNDYASTEEAQVAFSDFLDARGLLHSEEHEDVFCDALTL